MHHALEREYLADLYERTLRAPCTRCGARPRKPCLHTDGPRKGKPMAKYHGVRSDEANVRGYVKGPRYWRAKKANR
jgi:hypothetical protein